MKLDLKYFSQLDMGPRMQRGDEAYHGSMDYEIKV